ncbi:YceI family protein [Sphingomonas sp. R3G8C]|uniref:YceI family protein n=1 Tax=Novosphingobium rhizosphaerae TaxID=1551649 RepID=UPI0017F101A0
MGMTWGRLIAMAAIPAGIAGFVHAQGAPATAPMPPAVAMAPASKDPAAAPAGRYNVDLEHSSVVARVLHRGMSYNVLRFGVRQGTLQWDPANAGAIALDVTVDAKPFYAPIVYKIPPESAQSLNVAAYPEARFVSRSVRQTTPGHALIDGDLTLMGVTKPATIEAELVGVGRSMEGAPTAGFTGSMVIDTTQFTQTQMSRMVGKVTVVLDAEFIKG